LKFSGASSGRAGSTSQGAWTIRQEWAILNRTSGAPRFAVDRRCGDSPRLYVRQWDPRPIHAVRPYTFVETRRDPATGEPVDVDKAFADVIEQIELADRVGLDVFGLGEHHRPDYAVSAPAVALAAAAARTKRIRLTSAVTVLSSDDPVRVYQQFATLDLISGGRAEIMAGRGSFIESFPLFGYDLNDYDELFAEKLDLLLQIRDQPNVTWQGLHRAPLKGQGVYPRAPQQPLPVWIASGGTPQSVARAGALGLPLAIAIIGGEPARFAPLAELYREAGRRAGVAPDKLLVGINGHGFLADTAEAAVDAFFAPYAEVMSRVGRERGWPPLSRAQFDQGRGQRGHLMVGTPDEAIAKILAQHEVFRHDRYLMQMSVGDQPQDAILRSIELLGTVVAPKVRAELAKRKVSA
jgi:probable LLM family oxidoreductase